MRVLDDKIADLADEDVVASAFAADEVSVDVNELVPATFDDVFSKGLDVVTVLLLLLLLLLLVTAVDVFVVEKILYGDKKREKMSLCLFLLYSPNRKFAERKNIFPSKNVVPYCLFICSIDNSIVFE